MALKIGKVAAAAALSVETIRYYERLGLIPEAARAASGYRLFQPKVVRRLRFVRRAQDLGFSLEEIRELLELRATPGAAASEVKNLARAKLAEIEAKLADLTRLRDALRAVSCTCSGEGRVSGCPILDALDGSTHPEPPGASHESSRWRHLRISGVATRPSWLTMVATLLDLTFTALVWRAKQESDNNNEKGNLS